MTGIPYLTTSGLCVGYQGKAVDNFLFKNLNVQLNSSQLVCFMGPNGIGKSSLIRTLAGLQKPLMGSVNLCSPDNAAAYQQLSVVLTDKVAAAGMTVYELVALGRYPYLDWNIKLSQNDLAVIDAAITRVNIQYLVNTKLYQLSDGQLQMVMIARALAQDTPIILLDEPTAHLDLNNRVEVMNILRGLSRTMNKAILVATHELDLALQTADVIWLTGDSKNILSGIPEDLVLDGSFDKIFRFKGFDLKTGKVQHEAYRGVSIQLTGEGHEYRWTKNALERSGFAVSENAAEILIQVNVEEGKPQWIIKKSNQQFRVDSIAALIELI
jgi:iron complex transport system ATP-binding protein